MRVRVAHASLQFGDSDKHHTADIEKIFGRAVDRRYAWVLGTEAGPGSGNTGPELLRVGKDAGYRMYVPSETKGEGNSTDCWIAVRSDLVVSGWKQGFERVIPGSSELYQGLNPKPKFPRWGPKGVVHAEFQSIPQLGKISLAVAHHLTKGQQDNDSSVIHGVDHHEWNLKLDKAIGDYIAKQAKGPALGFASMDRNASDRRNPAQIPGMTTMADELKAWQNTGHGDIDWILSTNKDGRVKAVNFNVLDDKEFFLNVDHWFVEGTFNVEALKH